MIFSYISDGNDSSGSYKNVRNAGHMGTITSMQNKVSGGNQEMNKLVPSSEEDTRLGK